MWTQVCCLCNSPDSSVWEFPPPLPTGHHTQLVKVMLLTGIFFTFVSEEKKMKNWKYTHIETGHQLIKKLTIISSSERLNNSRKGVLQFILPGHLYLVLSSFVTPQVVEKVALVNTFVAVEQFLLWMVGFHVD